MWDKDFYAPGGAAASLDIALRVWYFRFRRILKGFKLEHIVLPPTYGVMGTELVGVGGYWVLCTPWFKVRWEYAKS